MDNNFVIAIPSYKRAGEQVSLNCLKSLGFTKTEIYLFVQTEDDKKAYEDAWSDDATVIYRSASSISEARNNILRYFDGSHNVLMMDDDIKRFGRLAGDKIEDIKDGELFVKLINECFKFTSQRGRLFGIYPVYNGYFMERSISARVTVNTVLGFCEGFHLLFDETMEAKEDIDMCGKILDRGGNVYRFNFLAVDAKHRTNDGGCKEVWESDKNERAVRTLCMRYPNIFAPKKNNPKEVRLVCKDKKIKV